MSGTEYLKNKEDDMVHSEKMGKALMILERMVNQNAEDEIFQDFKASLGERWLSSLSASWS